MRGKPTDLNTAAAALSLYEVVGSAKAVERQLGLSDSVVGDIIKGHGRWGEYATGPILQSIRNEQKGRLAAASRALAAKCLSHAEDRLDKASAYQAVGMYSLLRQYERLDMNESTSNVDINQRVDASNADGLASRLARRLVKEESTS